MSANWNRILEKRKILVKEYFKKTERDKDKSRKEIERKRRYARKAEDSEKVTKGSPLSYQRSTGSKSNFEKKKKKENVDNKKTKKNKIKIENSYGLG